MSVDFSGKSPTARHIALSLEDPAGMNLSNTNARAFFELLGWNACDGDGSLIGEQSITRAKRAILRAREDFDHRAPALVRETEIAYGPPRLDASGRLLELRPIRMLSFGLTADDLRSYLDRFEALVQALADLGATTIRWS